MDEIEQLFTAGNKYGKQRTNVISGSLGEDYI